MKVPFSWLREYCDPGLSAEEVAELLSMRALEVERVSRFGAPSPEGFVIGRVLSAEQHPNADRLRVCQVDTGDGERTIVCGAPNVAAGQTVMVALPGAVMPGGQKLGKAKLRGIESNGMILSEAEMEIGDDADGIAVLGTDGAGPEPGTPLADVVAISDEVLELDLNPNRPDCLGVWGVAREVHAITGAPLAPPPWERDAEATGPTDVHELASVTVEVPELCPRFTARAFTDVRMGPSPLWMKARLMAAGQRPISNVVDITNYVMLLIGQPLHAFDLDRVPGGAIIVRRARDGERMTTLDDVERTLDTDSVVVADREQPSGIAGIMGGQVSEVSGETTRVLLEAATWNGVNILRTSSMLGLRSEASSRFEKQLHPELTIRAQRVASRLIVELADAKLAPGTIDVAAEIPEPHTLTLRGARVPRILGVEIPRDEAAEGLQRLGFEVEPVGDEDLRVTVTPERHYDVTREIDLIEEVGRLHGLDRLPRTLPAHGERGGLVREQRLRRLVEDEAAALGFNQAITWGFGSPSVADRLRLPADDERRRVIRIANPLGEENSVMRTTLLGGLLDVAQHNTARDIDSVALFETGRVYLPEAAPAEGGVVAGAFPGRMGPPAFEPLRLGLLAVGELVPDSWRAPGQAADFFALKGVLEALCQRFAVEPTFAPASEPFLHPGRAARVEIAGTAVGWLGELHPLVAREWDLENRPVAAAELDLAPLFDASPLGAETYEDLVSFPAVFQDLAVVVPDDVPAERVRQTVLEAGGELLRAARIFDLYRGEQLGEGRKSLALRLEFRAPDRTLTDAEVAERREAIRVALGGIGGSLRE
ncbi:MAG TPA: phenylalanine--tRNA ligase subunit beta [Solirubrobacterales bacterium]